MRRNVLRVTACMLSLAITAGSAVPPVTVRAEVLEGTKISRIDIDNPAYTRSTVLEVDGKPFWYNGIQIRIDKLRDDPNYACGDEELQALFNRVADDGFTVANSQIRWTDIQPNHTVQAVESAYVMGGSNGDQSHSGGLQVQKGTDESKTALGYVKFRISDRLPSEIDGAKIRLYLKNALSSGRKIKLYGIENDTWSKDSITWNNAPDREAVTTGKAEAVVESAGYDLVKGVNYYDFNISEYIKTSDAAKDGTVSFVIQDATQTATDKPIVFDATPQLIYSDAEEYDFTYL